MNTEKILQKYPNSPRVLNFREMARTSKIDQLVFDMTLGQLEKMQKAIIQLEDLDYVEHLSPEELNNIVNINRHLHTYYENIRDFDLLNPNNVNIKNNLEQSIKSLFTGVFIPQVRPLLTYLKQEFSDSAYLQEDFSKSIANIKSIEKNLQERIEKVDEDLKNVKTKGVVVSTEFLSKEFDATIQSLNGEQNKYPKTIYITFAVIVVLIIVLGLTYFIELKDLDYSNRIEYGILSFLLIGTAFYLLRYFIRRQNILLHNIQLNIHRRNIAQTIRNFAESESQDGDIKSKLLEHGVQNMFCHDNTGYLNKDQMDTSFISPTIDLIKTFKS